MLCNLTNFFDSVHLIMTPLIELRQFVFSTFLLLKNTHISGIILLVGAWFKFSSIHVEINFFLTFLFATSAPEANRSTNWPTSSQQHRDNIWLSVSSPVALTDPHRPSQTRTDPHSPRWHTVTDSDMNAVWTLHGASSSVSRPLDSDWSWISSFTPNTGKNTQRSFTVCLFVLAYTFCPKNAEGFSPLVEETPVWRQWSVWITGLNFQRAGSSMLTC